MSLRGHLLTTDCDFTAFQSAGAAALASGNRRSDSSTNRFAVPIGDGIMDIFSRKLPEGRFAAMWLTTRSSVAG